MMTEYFLFQPFKSNALYLLSQRYFNKTFKHVFVALKTTIFNPSNTLK